VGPETAQVLFVLFPASKNFETIDNMNWLAHLLLSEPEAAFRIGNILPDILTRAELQKLSPIFQAGAETHRLIDAFTDCHPIVRRSIGRFVPPFRRFGGILVDVFYDHFLAVDWINYSEVPLETFAHAFYDSIEVHRHDLPPEVFVRFQQMRKDDWLCSYRELTNVRTALHRIGSRLRKPFPLSNAVSVLEADYESFRADCAEFFPQLRGYVESTSKTAITPSS